jgi:hypothetical protein
VIIQRYSIKPKPSTSPAILDRMTAFWRAGLSRDLALERVEAAANARWKEEALAAIFTTCCSRVQFISDDIWVVGQLASTREDRALGPILLRAARLGWCWKTDQVRPSVRSHLSGKPIWESLINPERAEGTGEALLIEDRRRNAEAVLSARWGLAMPRSTAWWPS